MKKKTWKIIVIVIFIIIIIAGIFIKNMTKNTKTGHANNSQEIDIFNISSFEAIIDMTVYSNKNENKYKIKQISNESISSQEMIEPNHIKGVKMIQEGNKLTLENSQLNLVDVIENYQYVTDNCIDFMTFIKDYQNNEKSSKKEENDVIILETTSTTPNPYIKYKTLTIDKKTGKPLQMEIKADNKKTTIYILYNEVKITSKT